jgi:hypothetical protein
MTNLTNSKKTMDWLNKQDKWLDIPRDAIHRIASTECVNGVKLLIKRITDGIPSTGHMIPLQNKQLFIRQNISYKDKFTRTK